MAKKDLNVILGIDTSGFVKGLRTAERKMKRFAGAAEGIGRNLSTSLTLPIVAVGAAAVNAFGEFEKMTKGLTAIAGGAEEAEKQMTRLRVVAQNPGIDLKQAVAGTIKLQAVGVAAEEAENTLLQFSKVLSATGGTSDDLGEVTKQLSQMIGKGKILASDFNIIRDRAPAIGLALTDAFGTTNIEAIRESNIGSKEFVERLTEAISKSEKFQSVTGGVANSIDNFKQAITASLVELGSTLNTTLSLNDVLGKLADRIQSGVTWFKSLDDSTQSAIVKTAIFVAALGPAIFAIGKMISIGASLVQTIKLIFTSLAALTSPVGLIIVAVAALAAGFAYLYKTNEKFRDGINKVARIIKSYVISAFQVLKQVAFVLFEGWKSYVRVLKAIFNAFVSIGEAILGAARKIPFFDKQIRFVQKAIRFVAEAIRTTFIALPAIFAGVGAEAESLANKVIGFFQKLAINAEILGLKIKKGLTIDGTARESLQQEIDALRAQKADIEKTGEEFGVAFRRAFNEALQGQAGIAGDVAKTVKDSPALIPGALPPGAPPPTATPPGGGGGGLIDAQATSLSVEQLAKIKAKTDELKASILGTNLARTEFVNGLISMPKDLEAVNESIAANRERILEFGEAFKIVAADVGDWRDQLEQSVVAIGDSFGTLATDVIGSLLGSNKSIKESFKDMARTVLTESGKVVGAYVRQAVAALIFQNTAKFGIFGLLASVGAGAIVSGIFTAAANAIPKLAGGGVIPPGYPNDTYPALLSSGERVIPPGKLPEMGDRVLVAKIDMRELIFALRRETNNLGRIE
jgi:tape measure domain-containing protein